MKSDAISSESSGRVRIVLIGSVPLILLALAGIVLATFWERIPERVAVHFGVHGPDRWVDRSMRVVYGPVIIGVEICAWLLLLALVGASGMRSGRGSSFFAGLMLWLEYLLGSMFVLISMSPLVASISQFWVPLVLIAFWMMVGIVLIRRLRLGDIREWDEFALSFANPVSWGLLVGTVLMVVVVGVQINSFFK